MFSAAVKKLSPLGRYRLAVTSRMLAAFGGGYALGASFAAACGLLLVQWAGMARVEAVTWSTMLSFVVMGVSVLWVFACRSTQRAWLGIVLPAAVMGLLSWYLSGGQA